MLNSGGNYHGRSKTSVVKRPSSPKLSKRRLRKKSLDDHSYVGYGLSLAHVLRADMHSNLDTTKTKILEDGVLYGVTEVNLIYVEDFSRLASRLGSTVNFYIIK